MLKFLLSDFKKLSLILVILFIILISLFFLAFLAVILIPLAALFLIYRKFFLKKTFFVQEKVNKSSRHNDYTNQNFIDADYKKNEEKDE